MEMSISVVTRVNVVEQIIDCDNNPYCPNYWKVEEHKKMGNFMFNSTRVKFHLSNNQNGIGSYLGKKLRKELSDQSVLNANALDYLLHHQDLIPEEWKKDENGRVRKIFFWGTIYRAEYARRCVRYLYCHNDKWYWDYEFVGFALNGYGVAALLA